MFGFLGLMAVLMTLILLASYWISWDLQRSDRRPTFVRKTCDDFVDLVGKWRGFVGNAETRQRGALDAYANQEPTMSLAKRHR